MLSSSVIKNIGQAGNYYAQKDNYYSRDEGVEQSEWWGKGAKSFQLSGKVDEKQFTELLQGKLPNGEQLGKVVDGEIKHRPGWDLTFSAPKSVSIMTYMGGDKRLIEAHIEATLVALNTIERSFAQARVKTPNGIDYQNTGNLTAALFHHDLSRAKDPQMHTHCVVMNMTERLDGKCRSLASQIGRYNEDTNGEVNGFIEQVRHYNRYLSKIYETELAYRVKQLGYDITTDTQSGIFEIAGVSQEAIQFFSKRRNQIVKQLEEKGLSGGKAAAIATLANRNAKEYVNREELKAQWDKDAKNLGLNCQEMLNNAIHKEKIGIINQQKTAASDPHVLDIIQQSSKTLSVFQTTFTLDEILNEASTYAIRNTINVESLLSGIETQIKCGELISLSEKQGKTLFIAKSTLDDEKRLVSQLKDNTLQQSIIGTHHLANYLDQHDEIHADYHNHLKSIFGNDRIVLIEGKAAKEALIDPIMKISKSANLEIAILSPNLIGSKQFANEVKQDPQTFWQHIKSLFIDSTPQHYSVMQFLSHFGVKPGYM
jgi:conjugative relaxase-like TrwC/TraI family protein